MYKVTHYFLFIFLATSLLSAQAQTARKPSYYENKTKQVADKATTNSNKKITIEQLPQIKDLKQFKQLARVFELGTLYEIPHILFLIDLKHNQQIYYINTPYFKLHENFIKHRLNKRNISRSELNKNYTDSNRQFLLGTISYQKDIQAYTYEFWEGDPLSKDFLKITQQIISNTFFKPVIFKTNSTKQQQVAKSLGIEYVTQAQLIKEQNYLAFNLGHALGQVKIINSEHDFLLIKPTDIVILKETPISLPPVAAIITEKPSTVLSHVNLLAKSWHIPNVYIKQASKILAQHNQQWITLQVLASKYQIQQTQKPINTLKTPKQTFQSTVNISEIKLFPIQKLTVTDITYCGSKAANLGQIKKYLPQANVPAGFCIPFGQYQQFMQNNHLFDLFETYTGLPFFKENNYFRRLLLSQFRQQIINTPIAKEVSSEWFEQWKKQLNSQPVFVRSSSNSEDLPNFNGAGLYTSVPHVTTAEELKNSVKTVWASIFNYEAYETRQLMHLPNNLIKMSVLIQQSIAAERSGVLITKDPFDPTRPYVTYIAAKKGIGTKVVEGKAVAEQVMYSSWSKAIQLITLSNETTQLAINEKEGLVEQPINLHTSVLTDDLIIKLADLGSKIKYLFIYTEKNKKLYKEQDIEWAEKDGIIYILQARPYIFK